MKITTTDLAMQANHQQQTRQQSSERLRVWRGERPDFESPSTPQSLSALPFISSAAREAAAVPPAPTFSSTDASRAVEAADNALEGDPVILLIKQMIEFLTGEEIRVFDLRTFAAKMQQTESYNTSEQIQSTMRGNANFGLEYDYHAVREESETLSFSAAGTIRTADGQEISFRLDLVMERHYREETHISLRAGNARRKDPLVVNFGGTAAQLLGGVGRHFRFDLNGDGLAEELPLFASGSGYLALDANGNGVIDSGKELFGPQSGNGFEELARLDSDGNGWIDENDPAFRQLTVWTPAAGDAGKLHSLAELGIGALGLVHAATPFALRDGSNADLGTVKATGLYLTENGKAGSLQEIDLTI